MAGSASGGGGFFLGRIVMAAQPSTPLQTRREARRDRTRMRGLLCCARHAGIGGTRIKRLKHRFENRWRRTGHETGERGCEVQGEGSAVSSSSPSLRVRQVDCCARSGLLLQRKQNQNKHLFAPPPRRFLNYRVGPRGTAHAHQSTAPPLARKYVGKNLCRRHNYGHQPIEAAAWVLADAHGPIRSQ